MGTVFRIGEVATQGGLNGQHIEIVGRDTSRLEILHMGAGLEVDARSSITGNGRDQGGNIVAQKCPLLTSDFVPLIPGRDSG